MPPILAAFAAIGALFGIANGAAAQGQPFRFRDAPCTTPPYLHCPPKDCPGDITSNGGATLDRASGRNYFLDYPCDLKPGEKVTVVLSLHGGGSFGNWQRHYFPFMDYKEKHRLVIATPHSSGWSPADDPHLQNIVTSIIDQLGKDRIKSFWFAAHSAGGSATRRLVCTPFYRDKVDGILSIGSGRIGSPSSAGEAPGPIPAAVGAAARQGGRGGPPAGARAGPPAAGRGGLAAGPGRGAEPVFDCDFSFIFAISEHEAIAKTFPKESSWAAKYGCGAKGLRTVRDTRGGYVYDPSRQPGNDAWGHEPGPGTAQIMQFANCRDGRVVADVVRLKKGHTEGYEPRITEEIIKLMLSARGGKIAGG